MSLQVYNALRRYETGEKAHEPLKFTNKEFSATFRNSSSPSSFV